MPLIFERFAILLSQDYFSLLIIPVDEVDEECDHRRKISISFFGIRYSVIFLRVILTRTYVECVFFQKLLFSIIFLLMKIERIVADGRINFGMGQFDPVCLRRGKENRYSLIATGNHCRTMDLSIFLKQVFW